MFKVKRFRKLFMLLSIGVIVTTLQIINSDTRAYAYQVQMEEGDYRPGKTTVSAGGVLACDCTYKDSKECGCITN